MRPVHELSVAEARGSEAPGPASDPEPVAEVVERALPGPDGEIRARFYVPGPDRPLPVLVYFFGGGWVLGSLDSVDPVCRRLANAATCAVVSVAYRRAPEHPFPAALEDCFAATSWVVRHGASHGLDPSRVAVGGASAGGNLAATVALLARERGGPHLVFQLRAPELTRLPPALVVTAELDPLRDEGELYAARLGNANVATALARFDGMVHGFFSRADLLDAAVETQALAASALRDAFERSGA